MANRGFSRLRALWASCQGHHHQHYIQSGWLQSRVFSAQAAAPAAAAAAAAAGGAEAEAAKKRRRKKKNFMEVAQFLPNWGIGAKFAKSHWPVGNFYRITNVKVYKSGRHGAAWGVFHHEEAAKSGETQKIGGVNKRCWRYIPEGAPAMAWKRTMPKADRPLKPVPTAIADSAAPSPAAATTPEVTA